MKAIKPILLVGIAGVLLLCAACSAEPAESSAPSTTTTTATTAPSIAKGPSFTATILEVGEDWLLVEADASGDLEGRIRVITEQPAAFLAGDRIQVWHTGQVMTSLPPQVVATQVEKIG